MPDFGIFRGFNEKLFGDKLVAGQLPTQLGLIGSEIIGFDPDYIAILDYAITQGYTLPSESQQELQNRLVIDLKGAGVWSKLDTFAVFATDGDVDFALIDWINLSQYTAVNTPTFTTNQGFKGNGTSSYIDTNFNPTISIFNYTQNDASRSLYVNNSGSIFRYYDGVTIPTGVRNTLTNASTSAHKINNGGNLSTGVDMTGSGFKSIHRTSSTNVTLFNELSVTSATASSQTMQNYSQRILNAGSGTGIFSDAEISMYAMGGSLVSENNDFRTAFYTDYFTNL